MNELINVSALNDINTVEFKNPLLSTATQQIREIYLDAAVYAEAKNKEIAKILGRIKTQTLYKEDGYTSVADYADKVFGIKKANAYSLAAAGEMYNHKDIGATVEKFSPSKLAELSSVPQTKLRDDIGSGAIKPSDTQQTLRQYADKFKVPKSGKAKVLKSYTVHISGSPIEGLDTSTPRIMDDWHGHILDCLAGPNVSYEEFDLKTSESAPKDCPSNVKRTLYLWYSDADPDYHSTIVIYVPYTPPKPDKPVSKPKTARDASSLSIEDLERLLAEKRGEAKAQLAAGYGDTPQDESSTTRKTDVTSDRRTPKK